MFQTPTPNHIRVHLARFVSALPLITDFWPVSLSGGLDGPLLLSRHIWNRIAISQHDITTGWLLYHQILIEAIRNRMHSHRVQFDLEELLQPQAGPTYWFREQAPRFVEAWDHWVQNSELTLQQLPISSNNLRALLDSEEDIDNCSTRHNLIQRLSPLCNY